jgi:hypothetical protein
MRADRCPPIKRPVQVGPTSPGLAGRAHRFPRQTCVCRVTTSSSTSFPCFEHGVKRLHTNRCFFGAARNAFWVVSTHRWCEIVLFVRRCFLVGPEG